jgi:hypothetical protein
MKFSRLGFVSFFGSVFILLIQALNSLTSRDLVWQQIRFADVLDPDAYNWFSGGAFFKAGFVLDYILNIPLSAIFFCLMLLFFTLSVIFEN